MKDVNLPFSASSWIILRIHNLLSKEGNRTQHFVAFQFQYSMNCNTLQQYKRSPDVLHVQSDIKPPLYYLMPCVRLFIIQLTINMTITVFCVVVVPFCRYLYNSIIRHSRGRSVYGWESCAMRRQWTKYKFYILQKRSTYKQHISFNSHLTYQTLEFVQVEWL